jgi:amidohydrolase
MTRFSLSICFTIACLGFAQAQAPKAVHPNLDVIDALVSKHADDLTKLYTHLHENPELSLQEEQSAARMTEELKAVGFEVTTKFGGGHGVVGVYKNGKGPCVWVRADMDALPVTEQTGLPYASKVKAKDRNGNGCGVMHACGHDIHMTSFVGAARVLTSMKADWKGTLVFVAQPAEEIGMGARVMIEAGLFKKFPKPDYCIALHADSLLPVGQIHYTEGLAMANVDTIDITVKGKGGHGAAPHTTVDPVVLSAKIILDLQTIASRETNPTDPVVVTVGSIQGGTKHNIIPNEVKLLLTVRTLKTSVRDEVLKSIERIAKGQSETARAPAPDIKVYLDEYTPAMLNDVKLTKRVVSLFRDNFGDANLKERPPIMGGEDFGRFAQSGAPTFMYFLGTIDPERYLESRKQGGKPLPSTHNDSYAPTGKLSVMMGTRSMSLAVLDLLTGK